MTSREVAAYLCCSISTVRRLVLRGGMPHYRLGKMVRFRRSEIDGWLAVHRRGDLLSGNSVPSLVHPGQLSLFE